jgi:hypothetical protein
VLVVEQFACVARGRKTGRKWLHLQVVDCTNPRAGKPETAGSAAAVPGSSQPAQYARQVHGANPMGPVFGTQWIRPHVAPKRGCWPFCATRPPLPLKARDVGSGAGIRSPSRAQPVRYSRTGGVADSMGPCHMWLYAETCGSILNEITCITLKSRRYSEILCGAKMV